jgi:hypothetical protein
MGNGVDGPGGGQPRRRRRRGRSQRQRREISDRPRGQIRRQAGAAMRKKAIFNVYTVGSYVRDDFQGKTAEDLAGTDTLKQLHLVIQRSISGEDMANAFRDAIRANYSDGFNDELEKLTALMKASDVEKGNEVWITNYPGYGLNINLVGKKSEFIKGTKFAKAVWDIYLGPKNVGDNVKKALVSRL